MERKNKSLIWLDLDSVIARDPATHSKFEAAFFSSGFHAIVMYRLNHWLWEKNWRLTARFLSQITRFFTGIEIHPAAKIGGGFFIDHGMGVVIGETAEVGENVTLYHGVTLGGTTVFGKNGKITNKRHPTLGNNVIVGSGAQILGPIHIGNDVKVGSNAVVVKDVENNSTVVGVPAHKVEKSSKSKKFCAYAVDKDNIDPIDQDIKKLQIELKNLREKFDQIQKDKLQQ